MFESVRRLFRHLVVYGSADAAALALNTLLLPVFTRVLSLEEYGVLALVLVVEAFLKVAFRWGFDTSFLRLHYDRDLPERQRELAGTAAIFLIAANGVLLALLWLVAPVVGRLLFGVETHTWLLQLLAVNLFISNFQFLPLTQLRIEERSRAVAGWSMVRAFGTIAARLVFVVALRWSVLGFVVADLLISVVLVLGLWPTWSRMTTWRFSPVLARELLVVGLPRVPHGALHQVTAMADRLILGWYLPLGQLGLYSVASSVAATLKLYPVALVTAWTPLAFEAMKRPDAAVFYARTSTYAFVVLAALASALVLFGDPIIRLLTPMEYHAAARLLPWLVLGLVLQAGANFMSTALQIAKRLVPFPVITLIAAVASVVANVALIPRFGTQGAALATVLAQGVLLLATTWFAQRAYPIPYERSRLLRITSVGVAVGAAGVVSRGAMPTPFADVLALALLASFPAGILIAGVFRPTEIASLRDWVRTTFTRPARQPGPGA